MANTTNPSVPSAGAGNNIANSSNPSSAASLPVGRAPVRRVVGPPTSTLTISYGTSPAPAATTQAPTSTAPTAPMLATSLFSTWSPPTSPPCRCTQCADWMDVDDKMVIIRELDLDGRDWMVLDAEYLDWIIQELNQEYHHD
ncbi:hypothetical protein PVAG01_10020 [Phlyctema vagabunda]|uniref:Uncharacterized protein n=1 Tax=Phlyctema vagabunda TaxID=108571 RepID=A0ABR4P4R9_9HELO